jgi:iron complex outermembrane recepter protein
MSANRVSIFMFPFLLLMFVVSGWAQTTGSIEGVVNDSEGKPIPGVTVTITSEALSGPRSAYTNEQGVFRFPSVPVGTYSVEAAGGGFEKIRAEAVVVRENETANVPLTMKILTSTEITVTATKREELLRDVPFSVAAPTEEVLAERGVENIEGIAANVAGFSVQNLGPGQSQVAMRGISAGQIVRDQPGVKEQVGIYLDEAPISLSLFTPDLDLFDVNRVEVLRGPQGTLFGSGSLSGTVRYITNQPELGVTRSFAELGGNYIDGGDGGANVKFGLNAPLGDTAAVRVVGYYTRIAGWIDGVQPDLSVDDNVNTGDRIGTRVALTFKPNDQLTITPRVVYQRMQTDGWNRVDEYNILANPFTTTRPAVDLGEREEFVQLQEDFRDDFVLANLDLQYDFGNVVLNSISSYIYRDVLVIRDATSLTASITGGSIGLPENVYTLDSPLNDATTADVFTQELRLSGDTDRVQWLGGFFYTHSNRDYGQDLPTTGFTALTGIPTQGLLAPTDDLFFSRLSYDFNQVAFFGEATFSLTDRLFLTGGLRYYHFDEDKQQVFDGIFGNDNNGTSLVSQPGSTSADGVAPRFILSYHVTDQTNINGQVSKGFRLGGINDPLNVPLCTPQDLETFSGRESWKDEKAWNYEVGTKSSFADNRASVNASVFYVDINDLQATVTAGSCSSRLIFNVPKARSTGVELEFSATPNPNFDFALSLIANNSELQSTVQPISATGIVDGRRLPTVPEFQLASAATYQWQAGEWLPYVTGTYQYVGDRFTQVGDQDLGTLNLLSFAPNTIGGPLTQSTFNYDPKLPAYDIVNLRFGVRRANYDLSFFVNNVTDERALLAFDRERGTRARIFFMTNQPRTFGVTTRFNF